MTGLDTGYGARRRAVTVSRVLWLTYSSELRGVSFHAAFADGILP